MLFSESSEKGTVNTSHILPIARLGYRPYNGIYPQQSIESYEQAYDVGHRIMLADLRLTCDGSIVCCHDDDISKVNAMDSNGNRLIQGQVYISKTTLDNLLKYDFSDNKGTIRPLTVLQFESFMEFCSRYTDITPCLEFKTEMNNKHLEYITDTVKKYGFQDKIMFVCSHEISLMVAKKLPNSILGRWVWSFSDSLIEQMASYNVKGKFIYVGKEGKSWDDINLQAYKKAIEKGVDFGFTYISNTEKSLFDELKSKCIFNYCKYIGLDEISWFDQ